jgi:hypothetical protein
VIAVSWQNILTFLVGVISFPVVVLALQRFKPEVVANFLISWLFRIFEDKERANAVSNMLGLRLIVLGVNLVTGIEDDEEVKQALNDILMKTSELMVKLGD